MWKIQRPPSTNLAIQIALTSVFTILLWDTALALSDKRLCADEKCKEIISMGRGVINYPAGEEGMVSFKINSPVRIKSKSAGSDKNLWGIEVNGREGYAPKKYIREEKVLIKEANLKFLVDVVKPGSEVPATEPHILNSSEVTVEATTTKPLEAIAEETITSKPVENASAEQPELGTPVQQAVVVDGTRIPTLDDNVVDNIVEDVHEPPRPTSGMENYNDDDEEDEDDGEIGDYDDDEDDGDSEENYPTTTSTMQMQPSTISDNTDNNNSVNSKESAEEHLNYELASEKGKLPENVQTDSTNSSQNVDIAVEHTTVAPVAAVEAQLPPAQVLNEALELPVSNEEVETVAASVPHTTPPSPFSKSPESSQTVGDTANTTEVVDVVENTEKLPQEHHHQEQPQQEPHHQQLPQQQPQQHPQDQQQQPQPQQQDQQQQPLQEEHHPQQKEVPIAESKDIPNVGKPENTTSEAAVTTANDEEKNVHKNNISNEQSLPNNTTNNDETTTTEKSLPEGSTETIKVSGEELVSDNIQHTSPNPEPSVSPPIELPTEQASSSSITPETDNPPQSSFEPLIYQYSANTQTEDVQKTPETSVNSQTVTQPEMHVTEEPQEGVDAHTPLPKDDPNHQNTNEYVTSTPYNPYDYVESSNTPLPPQYESNNNPTELPQTDAPPHYDYYVQQPTGYAPTEQEPTETTTSQQQHISPSDIPTDLVSEVTTVIPNVLPSDNYNDQISYGHGSVEPLQPVVTPEPPKVEEEPKALPSLTPPISSEELENKDSNRGLFATIMDTVNNILPNNKKSKHATGQDDNELNRILYPDVDGGHKVSKSKDEEETLFCEKMGPNECPNGRSQLQESDTECVCSLKSLITTEFTFDTFAQALAAKVLEISELLAFLAIVAAASLFFIFGYYYFCNSSNEGALLSKLNQLESSLLASHKENAILKHNLMSTRQKLVSIEDNSFGSNDMVVSIKKELEEELVEKARLQEQITTLQKELENAADAGIELNKIVSELLSNQTGDESIISSVEELQKQLNEQQNTILEINASLAEKSRENSELQLLIAEQNARYESEISNLQRDNDELEAEKSNLQSRLEENKTDFDKDITAALEGKNFEIKRLQNEIVDLTTKVEAEHTKWQTSMAKVEALEECLQNVKRDPNVNITQVIDVANIRAELLDAQRKYTALKERLELELDARKLSENQLNLITGEVEKLKQDFNQSEKDKLEAQTRLEVLSNYFKDKETQLQKELSLKETMWLKQQGETTTTVDRLTTMQEEIQSLKSQNDALRAEIEAQVAAHKAQTGTLENRAHETWLAARQSDRRYEEARAEATALRRKLTALAGGNVNEANKPSAGPAGLGDDLTNAPSPIHMESPGSPMLGRMPPPPFLPPPFMAPPPFMGMPPPPPFVPPGEMRPAPLGRIMSPPPPQRSSHLDYDDYMDYEGNNSWHRHHTYSPPPRTYRSLSPTDSRYNYGTERDLMSTYDTETDFSPPPSPREARRRGGRGGGTGGYGSDKDGGVSNSRNPYNNSKSSSGNKGNISSGSDKSYNSSSKHGSKSKPSGGGGGKSLV